MPRIWDDILSEQDRQVIERAEYRDRGAASWGSRGLGEHPAVLVLDMQNMACGPNVPILQAIKGYRTAMGEIAWAGIEQIRRLLAAARQIGVPVIYFRLVPPTSGMDESALAIVEPLTPVPGELVIDKAYSSPFYGTILLSHLVRLRIDTAVVVGNSTSGCVRATAIDARQHGFSVVVPEECTFDRIQISHKASLLDLWMKYAEVLPMADVIHYMENLKH